MFENRPCLLPGGVFRPSAVGGVRSRGQRRAAWDRNGVDAGASPDPTRSGPVPEPRSRIPGTIGAGYEAGPAAAAAFPPTVEPASAAVTEPGGSGPAAAVVSASAAGPASAAVSRAAAVTAPGGSDASAASGAAILPAWLLGPSVGSVPSMIVAGVLTAWSPRLQMPTARAAADAASRAPAATSDLRPDRFLCRPPLPLPLPLSPPAIRIGSATVDRLATSRSSLLASSRALSIPARVASASDDSFGVRGPPSRLGSWHRSARATRSTWRLLRLASAASLSPHSTGRSPSLWSTCAVLSWQWAMPRSWRSATTAASAATPAARSAGSVSGRVAQVSELTNSVCMARPPSGVSTMSTNRTTPGWSRLLSISASRSMSPARSARTCLTAISRSADRLTVTAATARLPRFGRCHRMLVGLAPCTCQQNT